ncbi:MAG: serine hydrolase, partial [Stackebrandtia sp.]
YEARHGMTAHQYQTVSGELTAQGFRPVDICGYTDAGEVRFAAVWVKSPMPEWVARHGMTSGTYQSEHRHWQAHGYLPWRVSGYEVSGQTHYAAIWIKGPAVTWQSRHGLSSAEYQAEFDDLTTRGFRPAKVNGFTGSGRSRYAAIWHKPWLSDDDETFIHRTVTTFITRHGVPGVSVALTDRGRLVFARGYGVTDPATNTPVTTSHLFRIASVSKPITAVAVFRLVELGQLSLSDRVLGSAGLLGTTFGTQPYGAGIDRITVQHLLEHTSGWSRSQDPMFQQLRLTQGQLIDWMLDTESLTHTPGTVFEYLNFGYCLLGRVVEAVTGMSYKDAVHRHVLAPCGITDMHIAGDAAADRRDNEVAYIQQGGTSPYGIRISRMDAHGGWIASPTDLMRLLVRVDGFPTEPDLLSSSSIATMWTPTTAPTATGGATGYAKGWATNTAGNRWHDGDVPGTASVFVRTGGGKGWALLVNSRNDAQLDTMRTDLDNLMWTVTDRITDWPAADLF